MNLDRPKNRGNWVAHWEPGRHGVYCGRQNAALTTPVKERVTCARCLALMRSHDHLPEDEET